MRSVGLDISNHKPTPIEDVIIDEFEFVVALANSVRAALLERGVAASKIMDLFVSDPYGNDLDQYRRCADTIMTRLAKLSFPKVLT